MRGRLPKDLPADDPARFTRSLRGGRTDFDPKISRTVLAWLYMLEATYADAAAAAASRCQGIDPRLAQKLREPLAKLAEAAGVFARDATRPWSRVRWAEACAAVDSVITTHGQTTNAPTDPAARHRDRRRGR